MYLNSESAWSKIAKERPQGSALCYICFVSVEKSRQAWKSVAKAAKCKVLEPDCNREQIHKFTNWSLYHVRSIPNFHRNPLIHVHFTLLLRGQNILEADDGPAGMYNPTILSIVACIMSGSSHKFRPTPSAGLFQSQWTYV